MTYAVIQIRGTININPDIKKTLLATIASLLLNFTIIFDNELTINKRIYNMKK